MRDEMRRERELEDQVRADDQRRMDDAAAARFEAAMRELTVDDLREMVNNSNVRVTSGGRISSRRPSGRDVIRDQVNLLCKVSIYRLRNHARTRSTARTSHNAYARLTQNCEPRRDRFVKAKRRLISCDVLRLLRKMK